MFILPSMKGVVKPASSENVPAHSHQFVAVNSERLDMSAANFGVFDYDKTAYSVWVKRDTIGSNTIFNTGGWKTSKTNFRLYYTGTFLRLISNNSAGVTDGTLVTHGDHTDTDWHHIMVHIDALNATPGDRMRMWFDGSEITSFAIDTNPSGSRRVSDGTIYLGCTSFAGGFFDGNIYQSALFSGYLPDISEVYNAGSPKDVSGVTGIYSLLDADASVTADAVRAADWTDVNTVTLSTDVPV